MSIDIAKTVLTNKQMAFAIPFDWEVDIDSSAQNSVHHNPANLCAGIISKIEQLPTAALLRETTLDTTVFLSLFTDARADDAYLPLGETNKRGWCGDKFVNRASQPWGSLIWTRLFTRANKEAYGDVEAVDKFIAWTSRQSLQHLIDDGVARDIETETLWLDKERLGLYVIIYKPDQLARPYEIAWAMTINQNDAGSNSLERGLL